MRPRRLRPSSLFLLLPALLLLCAATFALVEGALRQGEEALIQRRYQEAVRHLQVALKEEPEANADRVLLLLGRAQWLAGDVAAAVATYASLVERFPQSGWRAKARFQQAEALASARRYGEAAAIYRDEIERLTGMGRKEEVAVTYLELAQKAVAKEPKDWQRAVTFYDLALDLGLSAEKAHAVRLLAAEAKLEAGDPADAIRRLDPLVGELQGGELQARAMLVLGRARARAGDRAGARSVLRDLIAAHGERPEAGDAAYEIALTYGVPTPEPGQLDRAVAALTDLRERHPSHAKAKVADYLIARCQQHVGRSAAALAALERFLEQRGEEPLPEVAAARAMRGDVLAAQGRLAEATEAWRAYLKAHPAHGDWERVQRAIVDAEFAQAMRAYEAGKQRFDEARELFGAFARSYPLDERDPQIAFLLGDMLQQEERFEEAVEAFERAVAKFPGKDASSQAQLRIGEIFEHHLFDYTKALEAYRKVTWGPFVAEARSRIARLEQKHLALLTPRSYRTGEPATFELTSRNIEKVRVRVYRLDLEAYFRATQTAGDVARLDIEVIEPDKTFESPVPEYVPHKETKRQVAIGYDAPGAYVVKVDDRELEATTMVLITDLALIAKSSRHELFVFTQNVKENRAEGGAEVVVSDGGKVIAEGTTGADGVWRYRGPELRTCEHLCVFATVAGGSGAGTLELSGLGYTEGLVPVGFLFTDRPAYQPGQNVHMKGIVREAKEGLYRLPQAKDYRLQVLTASGRTILQREVEFTPFGTFAADLPLPEEAELGEWQLRVDRGPQSATAFTASFQVARYQRPRLSITASPERPVVFRGESLAGKFLVRWFFGEPAAGKTIEYVLHLPDGGEVRRQGKTNALGELPFSFETREFGEEAIAIVDAAVVAEEARTQLMVPVVTTEFTPELSTLRPVYLAGEPFDVTVAIRDRSGKPMAQAGRAVLLRREAKPGGETGEVEVANQEFRTAPESGKAVVAFRAAKGGPHVVRVEAKDRFGVVVTAQIELVVSGDDDEVKLRLLSDAQHGTVGEALELKVANRAGSHLVLRTIQGDGILAYDTLVLSAGESTMRLSLEPLHAPNFAVALAMIDGDRLHEASRAFTVSRALQLQVTAPKAAAPGSEVEVQVSARDAAGQPVAAEVALALVDEALLAVYPDRTPRMNDVFWGRRRETEFRTVSSCTWSYAAASRRVSEALVAEERRAEEAERAAQPAPEASGDDMFSGAARRNVPGARGGGGSAQPAPNAPAALGRFFRDGGEQDAAKKVGVIYTGTAGQKPGVQLLDLSGFGQSVGPVSDLAYPAGFTALVAKLDEVRRDFSETGGWISAVVTDAAGKGSAKVKLPDSTTGWKLVARGVTAATDVGEAEATTATRKELQADLAAPFALVEGDRAELLGRAHNLGGEALPVRLELTARRGEHDASPRRDERTLQLAAGGEEEVAFPLEATAAEELWLQLTASGGGKRDALQRRLPVQPFGVEHRAGRSGRTTEGAELTLSLPQGREYTALQLAIEVGADRGRDLIAAALGLGFEPRHCRLLDGTNHAQASRGLAVLAVLGRLERTGGAGPADSARLQGAAAAILSRLIAVQREDGGLPWSGKGDADASTTAQALQFFALAQRRGLAAARDAQDRAAEWLLRNTPRANEARTRAELALALAGRARFEALNALHRSRQSLELEPLARLALAWQHENRGGLAGEVLDVLRPKLALPENANAPDVEAAALAATALLRQDARDPLAARAVEWLVQRRRGATWGTPGATAAAVEALVAAGGEDLAARSEAEILVRVNGRDLPPIPPSSRDTLTRVAVPAEVVKEQGNRIELRVRGRGTVHWSAVLTGFARGFEANDQNRQLVRVDRRYLPALLRHDGKVVSPGFGVVQGTYRPFQDRIDEVRRGETARVETSFAVQTDHYRAAMSPLVVEEPIPAGFSITPDSVRGSFDHFVLEPDRLTLYYREGRWNDTFQYELQARFQGSWRALPTRVFGALRPDLIAYGTAATLTVQPADAPERERRLTPDELYWLGRALYEARDLPAAGKHLRQLLDEWHKSEVTLQPQVYKEVARMMLFIAIAAKDSAQVVHFFEELKDRYPELVIPFADMVAVGRAYLDLGEFERALMVFRGTAEASYLKDAGVAQTLEAMGEVKAGIAFLHGLLRVYPDVNTIRVSLYSIGQRLAALAAQMQDGAPVDERVGRRDELRHAALRALREFLVLYPEDPLAEEVSFAWATTWLEAGDLQRALDVATAALERYPGSPFEDELLYTAGYARFALGQHEAALAALDRVAQQQFAQPGGGRGPSENQWHAVYLRGQIWHARNEPAKALEEYQKVQDRFADAHEAADYFLQKELALPEVAAFTLAQTPEVTLSYRNLEDVVLKVYRVDLMRLYLLEKSLNDIRGVQLHGIQPMVDRKVALGDGRDYRTVEKKLPLPELKEAGAYLIVARGGSLLSSGMLLRSDLQLDVQEDLAAGRIRVNVRRGGGFVAGAHVKVVGSADQQLRGGDTDLRGVFVAGDLVGQATVIVKKDDEYAFYRGTSVHQPHRAVPQQEQSRKLPQQWQELKSREGRQFDALENNFDYNNRNRAQQMQWLQNEVLNKQQKGVEVYRAK